MRLIRLAISISREHAGECMTPHPNRSKMPDRARFAPVLDRGKRRVRDSDSAGTTRPAEARNLIRAKTGGPCLARPDHWTWTSPGGLTLTLRALQPVDISICAFPTTLIFVDAKLPWGPFTTAFLVARATGVIDVDCVLPGFAPNNEDGAVYWYRFEVNSDDARTLASYLSHETALGVKEDLTERFQRGEL